MARSLVQGCDIWLNNPLRPLEACGTSGMKAALNGGLNLSVLDGWWDEWFDGANGWAIPSADGVTDPARRDELEAAALYDLLGQSVAPLFYDRGPDGQPAPVAGDGRAHPAHARPAGPGHPDGPRVRHRAVRARRALVGRPGGGQGRRADPARRRARERLRPTASAAPASWPPGSSACGRPGRACGSSTWRPTTAT